MVGQTLHPNYAFIFVLCENNTWIFIKKIYQERDFTKDINRGERLLRRENEENHRKGTLSGKVPKIYAEIQFQVLTFKDAILGYFICSVINILQVGSMKFFNVISPLCNKEILTF